MTDREWFDGPNEQSKKGARWSGVPPLERHRRRSHSPELAPQWETIATSPALRERAAAWRERERRRERSREVGRSEPEPGFELDLG